MSDVMVFVLACAAAYRLWRLLAHDDLPPMVRIRDWFERVVDARFGASWAAGVRCAACSGAWCSFGVVGVVWYWRPLPLPALWFGAVSTVVILVAQRDDG